MSDPLVQLNDFMKKRGKITTEVVALVSHYMRKRDWIASFRTPDQLFKPAGFSIPKHMVEVRHRLFRNLSFYFTNYIAFTLFILFYEIFRSTLALFTVIGLCMGWYYGLKLKDIRVGDFVIPEAYKVLAMTIITMCVLVTLAGSLLLYVCVFCSIPVALHAALHNPMMDFMSKKDDDMDPENPTSEGPVAGAAVDGKTRQRPSIRGKQRGLDAGAAPEDYSAPDVTSALNATGGGIGASGSGRTVSPDMRLG